MSDLELAGEHAHPKAPGTPKAPKAPKSPRVTKAPKAPKAPKMRVPKSTDERYTPDRILDTVRSMTGSIALDPCTTADNRTKALKFFVFDDDGLAQDWLEASGGGTIYVNPPFSQLKKWTTYCVEQAELGCSIVMLLPGDTSTRWYHDIVAKNAEVLLQLDGRVVFLLPNGTYEAGAKQPTQFAYFGPYKESFITAFKNKGTFVVPLRE